MDRRTSLISAAAIAAVVLTGGAAVAANIGVLGAAGNDSIGQLTASGEIGSTTAPSTSTVTTTVPVAAPVVAAPAAVSAASNAAQGFQVQDAGTITVRRVGSGIELGEVAPAAGWTWSPTSASPTDLTVTFTSPTTIYVFTARVGADDAISAVVDQMMVQPSSEVARTAPATSTATASGGDDDGSEHHDDGEDHEEHEGSDDDD